MSIGLIMALYWSLEQAKTMDKGTMDMEVPDTTLDGQKLADRADLVAKYIASEKEKFGREIDQATAEAEVDEWLLKQATFAPQKTTNTDLALTAGVFLTTFCAGLYFANMGSS